MPSPEWRDRAVVIDFGLARDGGTATHLTVSGAIMGTPAYMAPEQARGDRKAIGPATDVYGLGATLYEMLTLRPPFGGETMGEVISHVVNDEPVPVRSLNPLVDRDLETIVQKAMEKEPARRYASAAEMAQDLDHWLAGEPIQARRASLVYRIRKKIDRNRLASAAIATAAALVLVGAWLTLSPGEIELTGRDLEGSTVTVDGTSRTGPVIRVWPPGKHVVRVKRDEFADFSEEVEVSANKKTPVPVALVSRFGTIAVTTVPAGAEVWLQEMRLGTTPLEDAKVPTGEHLLELRLRNYVTAQASVRVKPGVATPRVERVLVHETGTLTLTADPPELGVDLYPEGSTDPIIAAAPAKDYALATGRYRAVAHARNYHEREFQVEIRAGEDFKRNITLPSLIRWRTTADYICEAVTSADLNGDGHPDIVVASKMPPRIRAVDGRNGELIWITRKPSMTISWGLPMSIVDLDGDLEPELVYAAGDRFVVLDARTGIEEDAHDFPGLRNAADWGDLDGDGLPDFVAQTNSSAVALRGFDAKRFWSVPTRGWPTMGRADMDGDGIGDAAIGNAVAGFEAVNGRSGEVLWRRLDLKDVMIQLCVDVDGDGSEDVLASNPEFAMLALSGKTGATLWTTPPDGLGETFSPVVADLDGDGTRELVLCRQTLLEVRNLATGKIVVTQPISPGFRPAPCDLDGDGGAELIVAGRGKIMAYKPFTDVTLWTSDIDYGGSGGSPLLDDFDGDGFQDFAIASHEGAIAVLSASNPPLLWRQNGPSGHASEAEVLGNPPRFVFTPGPPHRLLDPLDGRVLAELPLGACNLSQTFDAHEPFQLALDGQERALLEVQSNPPALRLLWNKPDKPLLSQPTLIDVNGDGVLDLLCGDQESGPGVRAADGRTGDLLWTANLTRPWRADIASWDGAVWIPAGSALHGIDPASGEEKRRIETGSAAQGAVVYQGDLLVWNAAGSVWRFRRGPNSSPDIVWQHDLGIGLSTRAISCSESLLTASGGRATTVALDPKTGEERWRRALEQGSSAGAGLCDLDGDGLPEVAVAGFENGWLWVLSGKTGEIVWSWRVGYVIGWARPVWADLDHDGAPELVATCRDGRVYAFKVMLKRAPVISWLRPAADAAVAKVASDAEWRRRAVLEARRQGQWATVVSLAEGTADPYIAVEGVRAAARLADSAALARFANLARRLHVDRADVDLAATAAEAPEARAAAMRKVLLEAPLGQLAGLTAPVPSLEAAWQEALATAATEVERSGDPERAVAIHGLRKDFASANAAFERVSRDHAPGSRLRLARGRAAAAAGEYSIAREEFRVVAADPSVGAQAQLELEQLNRLADQSAAAMRAGFARGEHATAAEAGERLMKLRPNDPDAWNEFAWVAANSPGLPPDLATRAVAVARHALDLLESTGAGPGEARAGTLDTLAVALFAAGDKEGAMSAEKEALAMPVSDGLHEEMANRLRDWEKAPK
ncbi:MAG: FG-GAP-like repeat-containing protein [Planctomycetes bacterium]|nr:FG-GAP-like repeat-containing protein [Planctomycetota bacterium]